MVRTRAWVPGTSLEFDVIRAEACQKLPSTQLVQATDLPRVPGDAFIPQGMEF